jgi:hypothetical protein
MLARRHTNTGTYLRRTLAIIKSKRVFNTAAMSKTALGNAISRRALCKQGL